MGIIAHFSAKHGLQKQIIRLAVEERRTQEEVCTPLNSISLRTLQRVQAEALDLLAQL